MAVSVNFREYNGHPIVVTGRWRDACGGEIFVTNMETGILSVTFVSLRELSKYFSNTRQRCELILECVEKGIKATL
jgi:hypothetical protein